MEYSARGLPEGLAEPRVRLHVQPQEVALRGRLELPEGLRDGAAAAHDPPREGQPGTCREPGLGQRRRVHHHQGGTRRSGVRDVERQRAGRRVDQLVRLGGGGGSNEARQSRAQFRPKK